MMHIKPSPRPAPRVLFFVAVALCAALLPAAQQHATAQGRIAATAAPVAVAYHLRLTYIDGRNAGHTMDAGMAGMLDASGTLTATLTATSGATSTVMGTLSTVTGALGSTLLQVQGKAATLSLGGKKLRRGGLYGGLLLLSDGTAAGTWLLTPETAPATVEFAGVIHTGRLHGTSLAGTLTIMADRQGNFDGLLALDDGTTAVAEGRLAYGNLQIILSLPGGGILEGTAPRGSTIVNNAAVPSYSGSFAGPGTGDRGTWTAISSS